MKRIRDVAAYEQAMTQWVVPECLHVPIIADSEEAIRHHIGDIVKVISPGRAVLVEIDKSPERDLRLPIWKHERSDVFFDRLQVWVSPEYTRYRPAYLKARGVRSADCQVLAHMYNRRMAIIEGYGYIRLVPVSRRANSSSSFSEKWGVELAKKDRGERRRRLGQRIQYADLGALMVMLDLNLGGGIMEAVRVG